MGWCDPFVTMAPLNVPQPRWVTASYKVNCTVPVRVQKPYAQRMTPVFSSIVGRQYDITIYPSINQNPSKNGGLYNNYFLIRNEGDGATALIAIAITATCHPPNASLPVGTTGNATLTAVSAFAFATSTSNIAVRPTIAIFSGIADRAITLVVCPVDSLSFATMVVCSGNSLSVAATNRRAAPSANVASTGRAPPTRRLQLYRRAEC